MRQQRIMAAVLLVVSLLLWPLMFWLMFLVPKMAKALDETAQGEPLPGLIVLVIRVSNLCKSAGLLILPLVLAMTALSASWFVIVLTRQRRGWDS